jgi:hypothetical protein
MRFIVRAFLCLLLLIPAAFAQSDRGTITGTVSDAAGAMVPNAPIEAKNTQTGAVYQAASSATGNLPGSCRRDLSAYGYSAGI